MAKRVKCPNCGGSLVEVVVWDGVNKSGKGGAILVHDELECENCNKGFSGTQLDQLAKEVE